MLRETIILAWREIRANLMRSGLTALGIIIGITAVVAIVTVSNGLHAKITKDLNGIGGNLLTLRPGQTRDDSVASFAQPFRTDDVAALRREVPSIADIAPVLTRPVTAIVGSASLKTTIDGTDGHYLAVRDRRVVEGRSFTEGEITAGRPVCVIGETIRQSCSPAAVPSARYCASAIFLARSSAFSMPMATPYPMAKMTTSSSP